MINGVRLVLALIVALVIPGGGIFLALSWVFRKVALRRPDYLPVTNHLREVLYSVADWERDARRERPIRYWLTYALPKALRNAVAARRHPYGYLAPSDQVLGASFDVLVRYVESPRGSWVLQTPPKGYDQDHLDEQMWTRMAELRELYVWWKKERRRDHLKLEEIETEWDRAARQAYLAELDHVAVSRLANASHLMNR